MDDVSSIRTTNDGGYIMASNTCSKNLAGYHDYASPGGTCGDYWIVKFAGALTNMVKPSVVINPASTNICARVSATLTASSSNAGVLPAYRWTKNGINNRWGNKIFSTNDLLKGWDGTYKNQPVPSGVYIYTINGVVANEKKFEKGSFMLIR